MSRLAWGEQVSANMAWLPAPGDLAVRVPFPRPAAGSIPLTRGYASTVTGERAPRGWPRPQPHCGTGEAGAMGARSTEGKGWL